MRTRPVINLVTVVVLLAGMAAAQNKNSTPGPKTSQRYQEQFDVKVTGMRIAQSWALFGTMPNSPMIQADPGHKLVIVQFEVRDIRTGKEDTDLSFRDFEVEDQAGQVHKSKVASTDLREVPFSVADPGSLKLFRIAGLTFDIQSLAKKLKP